MGYLTQMDWLALVVFGFAWLVHAVIVDWSPFRHRCLSRLMDEQRRVWIRTMAGREQRIMDTSILNGLQNGTAFFASTTMIAMGAAFTLLDANDHMVQVFSDVTNASVTEIRPVWEVKVIGLMLVYAYAFFKFGWSYRVFNYAAILIGAVPPAAERNTPAWEAGILRASEMTVVAGSNFNQGMRALFFSVGYLGWFGSPQVFIVTTLLILAVLLHRQISGGRTLMAQITAGNASVSEDSGSGARR